MNTPTRNLALWIALSACIAPQALAVDSPFGVNDDDILAAAALSLRWIPDSGFRSVRMVANWRTMEPQQGGPIVWTDLDAMVNEADRQGLEVLLFFVMIPTWANGSSPSCQVFFENCSMPPTNPAYFPAFVSNVVNRYEGKVRYYGVWNEPDFIPFWGGTAQQFIDLMVKPGAQAIRQADPSAKVIGPDTLFTNSGMLELVLDQACADLDVISVHSYPGFPDATSTAAELMLADMDLIYLPMLGEHACGKPLWVTEFGLNSYSENPSDQANFEAIQAEEYVQALRGTLARSAAPALPRLERIFLYRMQDNQAPQPYKFGLLRPIDEGYVKKPSYFAVESYLRSVYETKLVGVDENLSELFSLSGSGSTSYFPPGTITRLQWAFDNCLPGLPCAGNDGNGTRRTTPSRAAFLASIRWQRMESGRMFRVSSSA